MTSRPLAKLALTPGLIALMSTTALAGAFDPSPVAGPAGDGYIFADPAEGVITPGVQAITLEPGAEYPNTSNPSGIQNCLMAANPDIQCDADPGSGKRIKSRLTGPSGMDVRLTTQSTGDVTEYYTYGKTSNLSGARIIGFQLELGTGIGEDFSAFATTDPTNAALFDTEFTGGNFNLPDGLFGDGGQEGDTGFFDGTSKAFMSTDALEATLIELGAITNNATYTALFGSGLLDNTQIPDGLFFDMSSYDPDADEPALIAWHNVSTGTWTYGTLGLPGAELDEKLADIADSLGVDVADLSYTADAAVPDEIVAAMQSNGLYSVDIIEDLRNLNLNFVIELGDVAGGEVTLRLVPVFADIVAETVTPYQFSVAGMLDAAAEVPYLDIGNAGTYQTAVNDLLALDESEQLAQLETIGYSFLGSYGSLAYDLGRVPVLALPEGGIRFGEAGAVLSTKDLPNGWSIGDNTRGFVSALGSSSSYDRTTNGAGYDTSSFSAVGGVEWQLDPTTAFGVMVGGGSGTADIDDGLGSVEVEALTVAVFGRKAFGEGGSLNMILGFQDLGFDSTREVMGATATGETDGSQVFAALKAQYLFRNGAFSYGPRGSLELYSQSVDGFEETGAGAWNLSVGDQSGTLSIASLGVVGEYAVPGTSSDTRLTGGLSFTTASGGDQLIQTGFVGLPSANLPVDGFSDQWVDLDLGLSVGLGGSSGGNSRLRAGYHGAFGDGYESHAAHVSLSIAF